MERIKCRICGSIGYSASRDVRCSECGSRGHEIISMDHTTERHNEYDTRHYLERIALGNAKPGAYCRD